VTTEPGVGKRGHELADPRCKAEQSIFKVRSLPPHFAITLLLHFAFSNLHFSFSINPRNQESMVNANNSFGPRSSAEMPPEWEEYWRRQPHATTVRIERGGLVAAVKSGSSSQIGLAYCVVASTPAFPFSPTVILAPGPTLELESGGDISAGRVVIEDTPLSSLETIERRHISAALRQTKWVIGGPRGAAEILGLHPNTLRSRLKKLGLTRCSHEPS
jgi:hypothetical protein